MRSDAYGQASLVSELDLNRNLLASLTDGSAATKENLSPPWHCAPGNARHGAAWPAHIMIARAFGQPRNAR